jgi:glycosyltransferase involved in cell wall biosynthesis
MASKKVALCMIVKNEAHVIERCLASTLPVIDSYCIVDTGSTDGTQDKIKKFFDQVGVEGKIHERPWVNFGTNRSEALELSRQDGGAENYTLMIDADEILEFSPDFDAEKFKNDLNAELYNVYSIYGGIKYHRPQLTSNRLKFYYRGVLHEYVDCHDKFDKVAFAQGFHNRPIQDGARSKSPDKYAKDAETFEEALKGPVDPKDFNRYHFYMAQCYRDSQQWQKAHDAYLHRATLGGWNEEVFYSLFQVGRLKEILGHPIDDIIQIYFQAFQTTPWRAESLWAAARLCRMKCRFDQAYIFAKAGARLRLPEGGLFVSSNVYEWSMIDELAIAAHWTGRYKEALRATEHLLRDNRFPASEKDRIQQNAKLSAEALLAE